MRIQKRVFKNQKPSTLYLIAREDHRKTIKLIKVWSAKYTAVTGIYIKALHWFITTDVF